MIAYIDSSVPVRAYQVDEPDHEEIVELLSDPQMVAVTGTWTRIEVSGALVRAARAGRGDEKGLLAILDVDLGIDGSVTVVSANQVDVESEALVMVRVHGLRAMDAWHLAVWRGSWATSRYRSQCCTRTNPTSCAACIPKRVLSVRPSLSEHCFGVGGATRVLANFRHFHGQLGD